MSAVAPKINGRRPRALPLVADEIPGSLAEALLAFAAEAPKLRRDSTGQIGSRSYGYASLDGVLDDVVPLLLKHGLLWTAKATIEAGQPAVLYRMEHVPSREFEEWVGPLPFIDAGPQALGSAITYMRRYTLVAYLNLAPGEDDDGAAASMQNHASSPPAPPAAVQPATEPMARPAAAAPKAGGRPASVKQRNLIRARAAEASLTDSQLADVLLAATGNLARGMEQASAERWLKMGLERLPAGAVDAVLAGIAAHGAEGSQS